MAEIPEWKRVQQELDDEPKIEDSPHTPPRTFTSGGRTKPVVLEQIVFGSTGTEYTIREFGDGSWHCTCLAWKNNHATPEHRHCRHTRQVQRETYR